MAASPAPDPRRARPRGERGGPTTPRGRGSALRCLRLGGLRLAAALLCVLGPSRAEEAPPLARAAKLIREGRPRDALQLLEPLLREGRGGWQLFEQIGECHWLLADFEAARDAFARAAGENPSHGAIRFNLGRALRSLKDHAAAAEAFRRAAELGFDPARSHVSAALSLIEIQRNGDALVEMRKAVGADPKMWIAHYYLGVVLMRLNRFGDAGKALEDARRMAPDVPDVDFQLGVVNRSLARPGDAITSYERFLGRVDPKLPAYRDALGAIAEIHMEKGEPARALEALDRMGEGGAGDERVQYLRSLALARVGRAEDARAARTRFAVVRRERLRIEEEVARLKEEARGPDPVPSLLRLARLYEGGGKPAEAESTLWEILRKDPANTVARGQLAEICLRGGRRAEARVHAGRVLASDPSNDRAKKILADAGSE